MMCPSPTEAETWLAFRARNAIVQPAQHECQQHLAVADSGCSLRIGHVGRDWEVAEAEGISRFRKTMVTGLAPRIAFG